MLISSSPDRNVVPPRLPMHRSTVDEYHHMIDAGVFAHDKRYELLEGWFAAKMTRNHHTMGRWSW